VDAVREVWAAVTTTQARPATGVVLVAAAVAAALVLVRDIWPVTRRLVTIAHEGAHGVAALVSGRRLSGIRLHSDSSGLTVSRGPRTGPGMVLTLAAGYPGPAVIGLGAAWLLSRGYAVAVLWGLLLAMALLLLQIRNFYGLWLLVATGVPLFLVSWFAPGQTQSTVAYVITWFLLLAAVRPPWELQVERRRGRARGSDADQLAGLTRVPGVAWVGVFLSVNAACLALGASWLLAA
jgi:hypothetical protein